MYWLRLLGESQIITKTKLDPLMKETEILIRRSRFDHSEHEEWPKTPSECSNNSEPRTLNPELNIVIMNSNEIRNRLFEIL